MILLHEFQYNWAMRLSNALMRKILQYAERYATGADPLPAPEFSSYNPVQTHYHIGLCEQAGYLEVENATGKEDEFQKFDIMNLTWKGHESLQKLKKGQHL